MAVGTENDHLDEGWERATSLVYRPLARSLVGTSSQLAGCFAVDVGSGTGF